MLSDMVDKFKAKSAEATRDEGFRLSQHMNQQGARDDAIKAAGAAKSQKSTAQAAAVADSITANANKDQETKDQTAD